MEQKSRVILLPCKEYEEEENTEVKADFNRSEEDPAS